MLQSSERFEEDAMTGSIIRDIRLIALSYSFAEEAAYGMARGLVSSRQTTIVQVITEEGVVGVGEAWGPPAVTAAYLALVRGYFVGSDLFGHEHIVSLILSRHYHFGIQNQMVACLSGIDMAIRDAIGRTLGVPVYQLLGGKSADRLPVYASGGYLTAATGKSLEDQLAPLAGRGFPGAKIKIGLGPASDEERVRTARQMLGNDMLLMVDANGNYTCDVALESMRRIAPYGIHWYEEPLAPQDFRGYRALHAQAPIPVATGEALYTAFDFKRLLDDGSVDVVQPDLSLCGGLGEGKLIARLAALNHVRLSPHVWGGAVGLAAACHFVASLPTYPHAGNVPYPCLIEYDIGDNPLRDSILRAPIALEDGHLILPEGPGLGIELDPSALDHFQLT
jgi:D-galactarolactone cycloisomerase